MAVNVKTTQQVLRGATIRRPRTSPAIEEVIRRRAYQFYVEGGRREGHAREDWLRAEGEVIGMACKRGIREDLVAQ